MKHPQRQADTQKNDYMGLTAKSAKETQRRLRPEIVSGTQRGTSSRTCGIDLIDSTKTFVVSASLQATPRLISETEKDINKIQRCPVSDTLWVAMEIWI